MEWNTRQDWWFLYISEGHLWFGVSASWPIKGIQDSPWILDSRYWIPVILSVWILIVSGIPDFSELYSRFQSTGFRISQTKIFQFPESGLDSGFQLFVGFRISWAVFRISKPRIPNSTAKISQIPRCGFPYMGSRSAWSRKLTLSNVTQTA